MSLPRTCLICERVALAEQGQNPWLIHDFEHSYFVLGDHQYFKGYALLLLKPHVRELHELEPNVQQALNAELMAAGSALVGAFSPWKMNYSCFGNTDEHVHWHLMPRYAKDPERHRHPWLHADEFGKAVVPAEERIALIDKIRAHIEAP